MGTIVVGSLIYLVVQLAFGFLDERDVSNYKQESIAAWVATISSAFAYFFFRSQHRAFNSAVQEKMQLLWESYSESDPR